jgi:hypothetical protein
VILELTRKRITIVVCLVLACTRWAAGQARGYADTAHAHRGEKHGSYFDKKQYSPTPLPGFTNSRHLLPSPLYDENPLWVELYWKAWELAFRNFYEPPPGSGFVSQFIDAAFNDNIFLWDTSFMTMFCNIAYPLVPGIASLDNFYVKQHVTGEICREIQRNSGLDFAFWANSEDTTLFSRWGWNISQGIAPAWVEYRGRDIPRPNPHLTLDALDHPILAWAELESYRYTGDQSRLQNVWNPLVQYYRALQKYLLQGNGLYITDWGSMDDSPRNVFLERGGTGIDISAEMVLFARQLAQIARITHRPDEARAFEAEAEPLARRIDEKMWDGSRSFYFDLTVDGTMVPVKTIAGFWPLLARIPDRERANRLVKELQNPETFWRLNPVPSCAADEPGYVPSGVYWRGGVWASTNTMVIRGLEAYGYKELARTVALKHLTIIGEVYSNTGTIWENYSPDTTDHGRQANGAEVHRDFVGWSGIGPILYFFEYALGLRPDAEANALTWNLYSLGRVGCERYRFNGHTASLIAEPSGAGSNRRRISVESDGSFSLKVIAGGKETVCRVTAGHNSFVVDL